MKQDTYLKPLGVILLLGVSMLALSSAFAILAMLSIQQKIELVKSFFRLPDTLIYGKVLRGMSANIYGTINTVYFSSK